MVHIRAMKSVDAEVVSKLYEESWRRTYGNNFDAQILDAEVAKRFSVEKQKNEANNPDIITLLAEDDGTVVGASMSKMDDRHQAWIDRLHILPEYFGSGLAENLMQATLAKHSGLQSIALKVLGGNERAIAFYEKYGFTITETLENDVNVGGATSVVMSRTIPRG